MKLLGLRLPDNVESRVTSYLDGRLVKMEFGLDEEQQAQLSLATIYEQCKKIDFRFQMRLDERTRKVRIKINSTIGIIFFNNEKLN